MFNPFAAFDPRYLGEFRKKGVISFVKQRYNRGRNLLETEPRPAWLFTHYNNMQQANQHFNSLEHDKEAGLIVLGEGTRYEELQGFLYSKDQLSYTGLLVKDANGKARKWLDKKSHVFIDSKTDWKPRSYEEVSLDLDVLFGQLYVDLKYKGRKIKVKLEEIENLRYVL